MFWHRNLHLRFTGAIPVGFEDDGTGFGPLPKPLPVLRPGLIFALLKIDNSNWLSQWNLIRPIANLSHFALLCMDDLVQTIAKPDVAAN